MNAGFRLRSGQAAQAPCHRSEGDAAMFRQQRLTRKFAARPAPHRASADLSLAATISFFGVLPLVLGGGLVVIQFVSYLAH